MLVAASAALASEARAWCRTTTCDPDGPLCEPAEAESCGQPLFWARPCVGFALDRRASELIDYDTALNVIYDAFATWTLSECYEGAVPSIRVVDMGPATCRRAEYNRDAGNVNLIMFHDERWPHPSHQQIALTTVTYQVSSGEIFDVDVEVNTDDHVLTVGGTEGYELSAVMVHELGHYFGLAHSSTEGATMAPDYSATLNSLTPDDLAGMCTIYPPGGALPDINDPRCNPIPRNGFSSECGANQVPPTCSATSCSGDARPAWPIAGLLLASALRLLRRRR